MHNRRKCQKCTYATSLDTLFLRQPILHPFQRRHCGELHVKNKTEQKKREKNKMVCKTIQMYINVQIKKFNEILKGVQKKKKKILLRVMLINVYWSINCKSNLQEHNCVAHGFAALVEVFQITHSVNRMQVLVQSWSPVWFPTCISRLV